MSRRVCATIHLGALRSNLARIRALAPSSRVMAVVKADGYGHGLERTVLALRDADAFGVASIADGERIRALGLTHRIVVLSGIDEAGDLARMRELALEPVLHHESQLKLLRKEWPDVVGKSVVSASQLKSTSHTHANAQTIWIKLDTGMHRLGFPPERARDVLAEIRALSGAGQIHLMTHFANSDVASDSLTATQMHRFESICADAQSESSPAMPQSLANSAGIAGFRGSHRDWVRAGGLLYGISVVSGQTGAELGFAPAMTLTARLIAVNQVGAGEGVGYGHAWRTARATQVGVLAVGYADGYPRSIAAETPVLVRGIRVPIIGRVSMDLTAVDLTDMPEVDVGEEVVLWGRGLPVEEIAKAAGTIGYELVCGMTRRVDFVEDAG
ncbi:MAG: alanine racemase [Lysobacterales bacterium]